MADKLILLTNDDGVWAPGLETLVKVASNYGRPVVVAPDRNRSAISSAMSVHNILRVEEIAPDRYSCDGTPVDCVLTGVRYILEKAPDWILSGINWGFNLGEDVLYSGTVGAAFEGRLQGVRSAAFSLHRQGNLEAVLPWLERFLDNWENFELPSDTIWNVNFPECEPKGFRMAAQGRRRYYDLMEQRLDPRGKPYFWIGGDGGPEYVEGKGMDADAVHGGFISVTPVQMDLTCHEAMARRTEFDEIFGRLFTFSPNGQL